MGGVQSGDVPCVSNPQFIQHWIVKKRVTKLVARFFATSIENLNNPLFVLRI